MLWLWHAGKGGWWQGKEHSRGGSCSVRSSQLAALDPGKSLRSGGEKLQALQAASRLLKGTPPHLPLRLLVKILSHRPILGPFPNWDFNQGSYCFKIRKGWWGCTATSQKQKDTGSLWPLHVEVLRAGSAWKTKIRLCTAHKEQRGHAGLPPDNLPTPVFRSSPLLRTSQLSPILQISSNAS